MVFVASRPKLSVIANQSADWCGNPPVRGEMYRKVPGRMGFAAIFGGNRYLVPFNRGIATPVCALARNDSIFSNNNLSFHVSNICFLFYPVLFRFASLIYGTSSIVIVRKLPERPSKGGTTVRVSPFEFT